MVFYFAIFDSTEKQAFSKLGWYREPFRPFSGVEWFFYFQI